VVKSPEAPKITSAHGGVRPGTAVEAENAASAVVETANFLWHEYEFSLRCRAFQKLVRTTSIGQRQAFGDDRVDLVGTEQLE
jgi:hypothetical protein